MKEALPYWKYQMHPYMDKMNKESAVILVIEMGWPFAMKEFRIPKEQRILDEIYNKWEYVTECIKNKTPPSHEGCDNRYCVVLERYDGSL